MGAITQDVALWLWLDEDVDEGMSDRDESQDGSYPASLGGLYVPPRNKTNIYPFQILWPSLEMIHHLLHASPSFVPSGHFPRHPPSIIGSRTAGLLPGCIRHAKRQKQDETRLN